MKTFSKVRASSFPGLMRLTGVWVIALLLVGLVFSAQPAQAATQATCTSTAEGDWSAAIWSCPGGPGSGDSVVIAHDVSLSSSKSIGSLTINAYGSLTFRARVTLTLTGNLTVDAAGIFDPGNDFMDTGGTVVFGPGNQTIDSKGKWIDFYNLSKVAAAAEKLTFSAALGAGDGVRILNDLNLKGTSPTALLSLESSSAGTPWQIQADKSVEVDYLKVKDSKNVSSTFNQTINTGHSENSSGNTGWTFVTQVNNETGVTLSSTPNPELLGKPVVITASILPVSSTGKVTFLLDNDDDLESDEIDNCEDLPVVAGKATCTTTFSALGSSRITAIFKSDNLLMNGSNANTFIQVVQIRFFLPSILH